MENEIKKNKSWLALLMLSRFKKIRRKTEIVMSAKLYVITAIRRNTMQIPAMSQKKSVGFGNFHAGN